MCEDHLGPGKCVKVLEDPAVPPSVLQRCNVVASRRSSSWDEELRRSSYGVAATGKGKVVEDRRRAWNELYVCVTDSPFHDHVRLMPQNEESRQRRCGNDVYNILLVPGPGNQVLRVLD